MANAIAQSVTTMATSCTVTKLNKQPAYDSDLVNEWVNALPEGKDNFGKGQSHNTLTSTGSGNFTISAVRYAGAYETDIDYSFHFGIRWYNEDGSVAGEKNFFDSMGLKDPRPSDFGNPGFAAEVYVTPGATFDFYLSFRTYQNNKYYSNDAPNNDYDDYSQLLYTVEHDIDKIMMIGFEDCWYPYVYWSPDHDYNDVIVYIEGDLPVPTNKRFFAEDLKSLDWDYNDVVVDLSNTGLTIRAVGGTLPVYLQVKNKKGDTEPVVELHEKLAQLNNLKKASTFIGDDGKTYYCPINVGAEHGVKLDPKKYITWTQSDGTRLNDAIPATNTPSEVETFGQKGELVLYVAPEYNGTRVELESIDASFQKAEYHDGSCPTIIACPVSVNWMKELVSINKAFPTFYKDYNAGESQTEAHKWYNYNVDESKLYDFKE